MVARRHHAGLRRVAGGEPDFPALTADYPAFATWQRRRLTPRAIERELEYWRAQLKTAPRLLDLPTDHSRRARQTFRGGHVPLQLDANLASSLRVLAADARASLFMVLLAGFQTLLGRTHGIEEISNAENLKHTAAFRLALGRTIPNLQASWVKMGLGAATEALRWGVNDLGGTLMEENISRMAGSQHGVKLEPEQLIEAARAGGREPAQRTTLYEIVETY